jgi:hypothetical protein
MTPTTTTPELSGAATLLASTVEPGEGFGRFAIPADSRECMQHLINGTPIEIPRYFYPVLMHRVEAWFGEAVIDTKLDAKIAQLTPISCRLNEAGKRVLTNENGEKPRREDAESTSDL